LSRHLMEFFGRRGENSEGYASKKERPIEIRGFDPGGGGVSPVHDASSQRPPWGARVTRDVGDVKLKSERGRRRSKALGGGTLGERGDGPLGRMFKVGKRGKGNRPVLTYLFGKTGET